MSLRIGDFVKVSDKSCPNSGGKIVDIRWNMVKIAFQNEHRWIESRYVIPCSPPPKT